VIECAVCAEGSDMEVRPEPPDLPPPDGSVSDANAAS